MTFALQLWPWLGSLSQLHQILFRVFPLARGIFEDKVANIWCFLSCLPLPARYKLRNMMETDSLARLSMLTTLAAILPTCIHLFLASVQTVRVEMMIDTDAKVRKRTAALVASQSAFGSVKGGPSEIDAPGGTSKRTRKHSVAGSDAGTERMSVFSGRTAGGSAVPRPVLASHLADTRPTAVSVPSPTATILPYAMLSVSMAFFLFGFQVHEKSILVPLLPLTMLLSVKGDSYAGGSGATDWSWAVLGNNLAVFSMWPLFKRDGIALQYMVVTALWNWSIGNLPSFRLLPSRKLFFREWFTEVSDRPLQALAQAV